MEAGGGEGKTWTGAVTRCEEDFALRASSLHAALKLICTSFALVRGKYVSPSEGDGATDKTGTGR